MNVTTSVCVISKHRCIIWMINLHEKERKIKIVKLHVKQRVYEGEILGQLILHGAATSY